MSQMSGYQLGLLRTFYEAGENGIAPEKATEFNQTTYNSFFSKSRQYVDTNRRKKRYVINKRGIEALRGMETANILRKDPFAPMGKYVPTLPRSNGTK